MGILAVIRNLLFFGCSHSRLSRVFTIGGANLSRLLQLRKEVWIFLGKHVDGPASGEQRGG